MFLLVNSRTHVARMQDFYAASAGKSWLTVVNSSSHTEFLDAGGFVNRIIAGLCGKSGRNTFQVIPALDSFLSGLQ